MFGFKKLAVAAMATLLAIAAPAAAFRVQLLCTADDGSVQLACVDLGDATGQDPISDVLALLTTSGTECGAPNGGLLVEVKLQQIIDGLALGVLCGGSVVSSADTFPDPTGTPCEVKLWDGAADGAPLLLLLLRRLLCMCRRLLSCQVVSVIVPGR